MTEAEWQQSNDPGGMMAWLLDARYRSFASDRKLRLFACACVRRVWDLLVDERSRTAVEVAERYADGSEGEEALSAAMSAADTACQALVPEESYDRYIAAQEAARSADEEAEDAAEFAADEPAIRARGSDAGLLREVFGTLLPVTFEPAWRTPTVAVLARAAYDERALPGGELDAARLMILADALEEAGCDRADLLGHLREAGFHARAGAGRSI